MSVSRLRIATTSGLAMVTGLAGWVAIGAPAAEAKPTFTVTTVVSKLSHPWDLTWVGKLMLFDQRGGTVYSKRGSSAAHRVKLDPLPDIYVNNEGGLLGLVADPSAASNKRFYTCQAVRLAGSAKDVRVLRWRLTTDTTAVLDGSAAQATVVKGLPVSNGRHSGCRLRFGPDGKLYVGTGDAATTGNPQNRKSLGGKVLRVSANGDIPTDNPFYAEGGNARYVWSYGHRNVQGLAFRPGTSQLWSAEHGSYRDDEINTIVKGGNYGWDPGPGYDESVPMTDLRKFPDAVPARWRSGPTTQATSGLTFVNSSAWGHWQGVAAVGLLKDQGIRLLFLDPTGRVTGTRLIEEVKRFGRIRTVQFGPDNALYFTTSNGSNDVIAKITPTAKPKTLAAGRNISGVGVSAVRTNDDVYAFIRTTGNAVAYKRSSDDGRTWGASWTSTGVTSTTAPSVASSAGGRVDLVTRANDGSITHTWFVDGRRRGQTGLGGNLTTATVSSLGDGTLDVWGFGTNGVIYRRHYGSSWSGWQRVGNDTFTSAVGASVDPAGGGTVITARSPGGGIYERRVTASSNGSTWSKTDGLLWSGRALGDRFAGRTMVAVSKGSDGYARFQQGGLVLALGVKIDSDPDVVTRPDGSWVLFGRATSGGLAYYDARPGEYKTRSLGGTVR